MSDYTKTTWVAGAAPGISAANLNKIEDGIDTAHSEIDTHTTELATKVAKAGDTMTGALVMQNGITMVKNTSADITIQERTSAYGQKIQFLDGADAPIVGICKNPSDRIILGSGVVSGDHTKEIQVDKDGQEIYVRGAKKVWHEENDGAGSGLDADLVRGRDIIADIERNYYDDYLRQLELYYTGHFSGPEIAGQKGMTFDGFADTNRVNTGVTTALVDTTNKVVKCEKASYVTPNTFVDGAGTTGLTANAVWQSPTDPMIDGNITTLGRSNNYPGYGYLVSRHDLGYVRLVSGIRVYQRYNQSIAKITRVAYSSDDVSYTIIDIPDLPLTSTPQWVERTFAEVNARYIAIEWYIMNYDDIYEIAIIALYKQKTLQATTKTLEANAVAATMYLSVKEPTGTNVLPMLTADNGHFEGLTLISSRADPLDTSYVEKKYTINFAYPGIYLILYAYLNPSADGLSTPEIKRYAIHWS